MSILNVNVFGHGYVTLISHNMKHFKVQIPCYFTEKNASVLMTVKRWKIIKVVHISSRTCVNFSFNNIFVNSMTE